VPPHKADIFIFTVGVDGAKLENVRRLVAQQGVQVLSIDDVVFSSINKEQLSLTRTPLATFGRFFMDDLLPASCRRIVYLDGDVLSVADPSALIDATVPDGRFAAAEDTIFYRQIVGRGATAEGIRNYFAQLNLRAGNGYFNAGVFAVSRDAWKEIADEAFQYFQSNTAFCKHFDQSALNAVVGDRRLRLSAKWNFQTQLKIWGADRFVTPRVCHFNRYPKPWMGICDPWKELYMYYAEAVSPFSSLHLPLAALDGEQVAEINASTRRTYSYLGLPLVSRAALALMNFRGMEAASWI
jgi:lipopolysaccharide biosynthesis glycosyltransferase